MYNKTITAVVSGLIGWVTAVISSPQSQVTAGEWLFLGTALATSFGVYQVANSPTRDAERGAVDPGSAALGALVAALVFYVLFRR